MLVYQRVDIASIAPDISTTNCNSSGSTQVSWLFLVNLGLQKMTNSELVNVDNPIDTKRQYS